MSPRSRSPGSSITISHLHKVHYKSSHGEMHVTPELPSPAVDVGPNRWWKYKQVLREPVAEFTGVMILIIFGAGVDCQVVLSTNPAVASSPRGALRWGCGPAPESQADISTLRYEDEYLFP
ncbi:hypothetical protein DXG03_000725 [Asterophora parasitica]|uniref:Uncharacterized protein n=1 Tax=Asterophora parasitica TaxID=117018 RepID=A0A9P7G7F8_9AGAR|nr:hypothetical protein DXG03_000725 [Asterophora parasitica]